MTLFMKRFPRTGFRDLTREPNGVKIQLSLHLMHQRIPDSKVHGANMGTIWGRQDPGGSHVGPMKFLWQYMYQGMEVYATGVNKWTVMWYKSEIVLFVAVFKHGPVYLFYIKYIAKSILSTTNELQGGRNMHPMLHHPKHFNRSLDHQYKIKAPIGIYATSSLNDITISYTGL